MEAIVNSLASERWKALMEKITCQVSIKNSLANGQTYDCDICNDTGLIYDRETNSARYCRCAKIKRYKEIIGKCGIAEEFRRRSLENFQEWNEPSRCFKNMAKSYIDAVLKGECKSIAFLGQSGSGKSHLTFAIANELMKHNIPVFYMPYVDKIQELKNLNRHSESSEDFERVLNRYKTVNVLLIDDLFKESADSYGNVNASERKHMFNIINERCLRRLPTIFSSEYLPGELIRIDEALGGRVIEMCGDYIEVVKRNSSYNYRLRKFL